MLFSLCQVQQTSSRPAWAYIIIFVYAPQRRERQTSVREMRRVTSAVKTNSLLRQWQLRCPGLSLDRARAEPGRQRLSLIAEEVARAGETEEEDGYGRSWRMDAMAFEFVYLPFVNSMFLSTFTFLPALSARLVACLFVCLWLAFLHSQSH